MLSRNVMLLFLCQLISVSGTVLVVTIGGLVGAQLAPTPSLATLPLSIMVIGTAAATVFAAMLMSRVGRRLGFIAGALLAAGGAALAAYAIQIGHFTLFCAGIGLVGVNNAFVQQYRFAAAESVPAARASTAVSTILLGAIGGAFLGPYLATHGELWISGPEFLGALLALVALQLVNAVVLTGLRDSSVDLTNDQDEPRRPLSVIVSQPRFMIAVLGGMVGYGTMTLIMTATPLSMHLHHGYSLQDTAWVIQSHVIAMYLPSLVSGVLVNRFGAQRIMATGIACVVATLAFGLQGQQMMDYWWALVLLGVGWNFLYVGGTALLLGTYRNSERYAAQAVNEFSVFGSSAAASLLAGTMISAFGWNVLLWSAAPLLVLMAVGLIWLALGQRPAQMRVA